MEFLISVALAIAIYYQHSKIHDQSTTITTLRNLLHDRKELVDYAETIPNPNELDELGTIRQLTGREDGEALWCDVEMARMIQERKNGKGNPNITSIDA